MLYAPERPVGLPRAQLPRGIPEMETFVVALVARNKWRKLVTAGGKRPKIVMVSPTSPCRSLSAGQGHLLCMIAANVLCLVKRLNG